MSIVDDTRLRIVNLNTKVDGLGTKINPIKDNITNLENTKTDVGYTYNKRELDRKINEINTRLAGTNLRVDELATILGDDMSEPFISIGVTDNASEADPHRNVPKTGDIHINKVNGKVFKYENNTWVNVMKMILEGGATTEIENSRKSAFTGTTYSTLGERLDGDFSALQTKINKADLVQISGDCIQLDNSISGITKFTELEGLTTNNLLHSLSNNRVGFSVGTTPPTIINTKCTNISDGSTANFTITSDFIDGEKINYLYIACGVKSLNTNISPKSIYTICLSIDTNLPLVDAYPQICLGNGLNKLTKESNPIVFPTTMGKKKYMFTIETIDNFNNITAMMDQVLYIILNKKGGNINYKTGDYIKISNCAIYEGDLTKLSLATDYKYVGPTDHIESLGDRESNLLKYRTTNNIFTTDNITPDDGSAIVKNGSNEITYEIIRATSHTFATSTKHPCTPGTIFKFNFKSVGSTVKCNNLIRFYDENDVNISNIYVNINYTGQVPQDARTFLLELGVQDGQNGKTLHLENIQFSFGIDIPYAPYGAPKTSQLQLDDSLKSLPNNVKDKLYYKLDNITNKYILSLTRRIKKINIVDNDPNITINGFNSSFSTLVNLVNINILDGKNLLNDEVNAILTHSRKIVTSMRNSSLHIDTLCIINNSTASNSLIVQYVLPKSVVDLASAKTYIFGKNVDVQYELVTPVEKTYKDDFNPYTLSGSSYIVNDNFVNSKKTTQAPVKGASSKPIIPRQLISGSSAQAHEIAVYSLPEPTLDIVKGKRGIITGEYLFVKKALDPTLHTVFRATSSGTKKIKIDLKDSKGDIINLEKINFSKIKTVSIAVHNEDKTSISFEQVSSLPIILDVPVQTGDFITIQLSQIPLVKEWATDRVYDKDNPEVDIRIFMYPNDNRLSMDNKNIRYINDSLVLQETNKVTGYTINSMYLDGEISCRPSQVAVCQPTANYVRHNDSEWVIVVNPHSTETCKIAPYVGNTSVVGGTIKIGSSLKGYIYTRETDVDVNIEYRFVTNGIIPSFITATISQSGSVEIEKQLKVIQTPSGKVADTYLEIKLPKLDVGELVVDLSTDGTKYLTTYTNGRLTRYCRKDTTESRLTSISDSLSEMNKILQAKKIEFTQP